MTDRELLELAAKAAGNGFVIGYWNPLTDDGDALRLAVALGLTARMSYNGQDYEAANKDPYAATRRAIVRAAAEIGRSKT